MVTREQLCEATKELGHDPDRVAAVKFDSDGQVTVTELKVDADGKPVMGQDADGQRCFTFDDITHEVSL